MRNVTVNYSADDAFQVRRQAGPLTNGFFDFHQQNEVIRRRFKLVFGRSLDALVGASFRKEPR